MPTYFWYVEILRMFQTCSKRQSTVFLIPGLESESLSSFLPRTWVATVFFSQPKSLASSSKISPFPILLPYMNTFHFSSVQFSLSVMSNSLQPHESQHARPRCSLSTPRVHSDSRPLSQWWHPAISSSAVPFSSCPQSLPASELFPMSPLFTWGGQSIGVSASLSVLPMNIQEWFPLGWTGWISLQSKELSRESSKPSILWQSAFFRVQLSHPYLTTEKP